MATQSEDDGLAGHHVRLGSTRENGIDVRCWYVDGKIVAKQSSDGSWITLDPAFTARNVGRDEFEILKVEKEKAPAVDDQSQSAVEIVHKAKPFPRWNRRR
jgi:hypothetical protein